MVNNRKIILSSFIILMFFLSSVAIVNIVAVSNSDLDQTVEKDGVENEDSGIQSDLYTPIGDALTVNEQVTLSPMFTPDNALDIHAAWIKRANTTIEVQNQYITQFDDNVDWADDPNPIVQELVAAAARDVSIRVQVRDDADSDLVAPYLDSIPNIEARYMGSEGTSSDNSWLSNTHNKLIIIDSSVTLVSSINFGENAFLNNREAGMVVQSTSVSQYFLDFFNEDWDDGDPNVQLAQPTLDLLSQPEITSSPETNQGDSFTDIPRANFSGVYNVSAYVNPDNADGHIMKYLESAQESIYVSMYTISREDIVDALVELKQNNPSLDIQVLISRRRVGASENVDTQAAALRLVENLIPVYNSTDTLNFYHNKYWIIDSKHTFIYSGNWSPRSLTPAVSPGGQYSSGDANRDMGISVNDAPDIASFIKTEVWDKDVAAASAVYELPAGISQNSFDQTEVVSGQVTLSATVNGLTNPTVSYMFGSNSPTTVTLTDNSFSVSFDTTTIDNGITTFSVEAVDAGGATFTDEVTVNVANYPSSDNFRFLVTEVHPNPSIVDDSEGEYFELTNSFPFALLIEGWQTGDPNAQLTFPSGYQIDAYTSIIIAKDEAGFASAYSSTADFELSFSLTNGGDMIMLLDQSGDYVDVVAYGDETAPDGSETITGELDAGSSIARSPLHIDTNRASDFIFEGPSPKDIVPEVALGETLEDEDPLPFNFVLMMAVLIAIPILRRKR